MKTNLNPGKSVFKIIHADDHKLFRQMVGEQINNFDEFNLIEQVDNGKQLVELITSGLVPEIVLLDINMPVMNGYETASWLRENHPTIKIIVFTIFENEHVKALAIQCGADAVITKNIDLKDLCNLLKNLVTQHSKEDIAHAALLTEKELELLKLMCTELKYQAIAIKMGISYRQVERIREDLFNRFKIYNRTSMVMYALESGIITGSFN